MRGSRQTKPCLPRRAACKLLIAVINAAAAAPSELSAPVKERVCHPQTHLVPRLTGQFVRGRGGREVVVVAVVVAVWGEVGGAERCCRCMRMMQPQEMSFFGKAGLARGGWRVLG